MAINDEVAARLGELVTLTTLADGTKQSFRVRAYERARDAVRTLSAPVADLTAAELQQIDGIGASTAKKIREYLETGTIAKLDELRGRFPPGLVEVMRIPGMGPKTVLLVRDELGVASVDDLRAAVAAERLRDLPGLGKRSEEKIAVAIERLGLHGKDRRTPIIEALPVADEIVGLLSAQPAVDRVESAGSLRRFRETIGDVDVLVASGDPESVMDAFGSLPVASEVLARGETKSAILTGSGLQVDLRVVAPDQFGAALLYFTGSKAHNIELRQRAISRGWILNEYALTDEDGRVLAAATEADIYGELGLEYVAPPLREGVGEVAAAAKGTLPDLVQMGDLHGDLHVHSSWSGDGRSSLEDMVAAAAARGLEYVAITEHAEDLAINGLSRDQVREEREVIDALRAAHPELAILHGAELNIGRDGSVDYDEDFLAGFDWCVASVHSLFDLPPEQQTRRLIAAMENPAVDVIGHLTGRRIGRRPGIEFDVDAVFAAASKTRTALEINCHLDRLDVPADLLLRARNRDDLTFVISTDSHHVSEYSHAEWGVRHAQRGWVDRSRIANTMSRAEFLAWLGAKR